MKHILIICLALVCVLSCKEDDDNQMPVITSEIVGSWNLIEYYADPGDGSGDFIPIVSDKIITFTAVGNMSSNANLCDLFSEVGEPSFGTYTEENMSITVQNCDGPLSITNYQIVDSQLIISYMCIEPCEEKYQKIVL